MLQTIFEAVKASRFCFRQASSFLLERMLTLALTFACLMSYDVYAQDTDSMQEAIEETYYQIEFILFKHNDADRSQLEYETPQAPYSEPKDIHHIYPYSSSAPSPKQLPALPRDSSQELAKARMRLKKDVHTDVLMSGSWQQVLEKDSAAAPVLLESKTAQTRTFFGRKLRERNKKATQDSSQDNPNLMDERFTGHLQVKRSRYTHVSIWLDYGFYQPYAYSSLLTWFIENEAERANVDTLFYSNGSDSNTSQGVAWVPVSNFEFKDSRRIKNGEVHYLDHPYLGLIVTISRVEQDDPNF